jgi:SAM-dependent methyltransferase
MTPNPPECAASQDEVFAAFEADRWFARNKTALDRFDSAADLPLRLMELYRLEPRRVLEIGAANGTRLAEIHRRHGAAVVGVEPSPEAIRDGRRRFPAVEFVQALAHSIPLREPFDLIIIHSVLHWVDRTKLFLSIAEIDRLEEEGGFLIIGDFLPAYPRKVRYHHVADQDLYTYKQDYAAAFLASGLYHQVGALTLDHASHALRGDVGEDDRFGVWLLRKALHDHYVEVTRPG